MLNYGKTVEPYPKNQGSTMVLFGREKSDLSTF